MGTPLLFPEIHVAVHSQNQDDALYHVLPGGRDIHDLKAIRETRHDERPDHRSKDSAHSTRRGGATQETSRNRVKLVAISSRDRAIAYVERS